LTPTDDGFSSVKLWQNETFHHHNHMKIIMGTPNGKDVANCRVSFVAEEPTTLQSK
jgi:hypothetical protein